MYAELGLLLPYLQDFSQELHHQQHPLQEELLCRLQSSNGPFLLHDNAGVIPFRPYAPPRLALSSALLTPFWTQRSLLCNLGDHDLWPSFWRLGVPLISVKEKASGFFVWRERERERKVSTNLKEKWSSFVVVALSEFLCPAQNFVICLRCAYAHNLIGCMFSTWL